MERNGKRTAGFSLIEVNMAIFVMAVGIMAMVALYPLGLRESILGTADLKQAALADYYLNQAVAIATMTNLTWSEWNRFDEDPGGGKQAAPPVLKNHPRFHADNAEHLPYRIECEMIGKAQGEFSDRLLGIWVQCSDQKDLNDPNSYSNNPVYYAEAYFMGVPPGGSE